MMAFEASGAMATNTTPPVALENAKAKALPFLSVEACMKPAHFGSDTGCGGGRSLLTGALSNPSFSCLMP